MLGSHEYIILHYADYKYRFGCDNRVDAIKIYIRRGIFGHGIKIYTVWYLKKKKNKKWNIAFGKIHIACKDLKYWTDCSNFEMFKFYSNQLRAPLGITVVHSRSIITIIKFFVRIIFVLHIPIAIKQKYDENVKLFTG